MLEKCAAATDGTVASFQFVFGMIGRGRKASPEVANVFDVDELR